jgi:hypothetical protein
MAVTRAQLESKYRQQQRDCAEENFGLGLLADYRSTEFRCRLDINITSVN